MDQQLIHFDQLPWKNPSAGVEQKIYANGHQQIRLLRFHDNFVETDWCNKGHIGFVLRGEMTIDFNGTLKNYHQGDGLWIEPGESSKHKVLMQQGKQVELVLFESI